jgi:RNA recognition motif-containing protein
VIGHLHGYSFFSNSVQLFCDPDGRFTGFGSVEFGSEAEARRAVSERSGNLMMGQPVELSIMPM